MGLVKTYGSALCGVRAFTVTIEVSAGNGVGFFLVGLPDVAVKESQQRMDAALSCSGYRMPGRKIIINMAPADVRKEGSAYDLPLAVAILAASGQISTSLNPSAMLMGELSLDGGVQPIRGVLPIALQARADGFKQLIIPAANVAEASVVEGLDVYGFASLQEVVGFLQGGPAPPAPTALPPGRIQSLSSGGDVPDLADVCGQEHVRRAMEVAVAGGHNLLMIGPPGTGKTMMARRIPGIMPPMDMDEALETTAIHSVGGHLSPRTGLIYARPFRAPHHTISAVAMMGGGAAPRPGEVSLAHNGVLFLDELPEFPRSVLEALRQPLEERTARIVRARYGVEFPAGFMLVAAMNPCPCGYYGHPNKACVCTPGEVQRYRNRVSGPLLDRIDLHVEMSPVTFEVLSRPTPSEGTAAVRERVVRARTFQQQRFSSGVSGSNLCTDITTRGIISTGCDANGHAFPAHTAPFHTVHTNAAMPAVLIRRFCTPDAAGRALLGAAMNRLGLSARAYDRILKLARTIADLDGSEQVRAPHIAEAIQYRCLDRQRG